MADPQPSLRSRAARGAAWSGVSTIVLRMGGLVVGIVLARLLAPEQFGVYAVALTVQSILITVADLGLSADLIRSDEPERIAPTVATLGLASGTIMAAVTIVSSTSVATLLGSPAAAPAIAVLAVTLVFSGATVVPFGYLQRRFQQREMFFVGLADFIVSTVVTLVLVALGFGVLGLALGRVAAQAVSSTMQFIFARIKPRYSIDRAVVGRVLAFGLPIAGANLLSWALLNVDNVVLARVTGATLLGYYVLAFNISGWPMSALSQVVRSISLAVLRHGRNQEGDQLATLTAIAWAVALPVGADPRRAQRPAHRGRVRREVAAGGSRPRCAGALREHPGRLRHLRRLPLRPWSIAPRALGSDHLAGRVDRRHDLRNARLRDHRCGLGTSDRRVRRHPARVCGGAPVVRRVLRALPACGVVADGGDDPFCRGRDARARIHTGCAARSPCRWARSGGRLRGTHLALAASPAEDESQRPPAERITRMTAATEEAVDHRPSGWRHYLEDHSLDNGFLALLARLPHGTPRRAATEPARRLAPRARATVSVVIPCFNYGRFLPDAVGSALDQTGVDVEVIIVDDRSTDDSRSVARRLCDAQPGVQLLVNDVNVGHIRSFNAGWEASTGEYVVKLDADDLLAPGALARAAALFESYPEVGLVYGHPYHFSTAVPPAGRLADVRWDVWRGHDWLEERCRLGVSAITNPEMVMKASLLRELGSMDPAVRTPRTWRSRCGSPRSPT